MLTQQGLKKALKGEKPHDMTDEDYEDLVERAISMIYLSMANKILSTKSLSNKLFMKQLFRLMMPEG